jgi:hypothetical protein
VLPGSALVCGMGRRAIRRNTHLTGTGYGSDVYEDRALWACYPLVGWYVTDSTPVLRVLDSTSLRCT